MPRKNRVHYRNAFYHVIMRGNFQQQVFYDDEDRKKFYHILADVISAYSFKVHIFCLMGNHMHFVIEVGDIPLSKIMQCVTARYSIWHNKKFNKKGHLFEGRYGAFLVHDDRYLLELCFYTHMNPVKAGMCKLPNDYLWSSHLGYTHKVNIGWLTTTHVENLLIHSLNCNENYYLEFMRRYKEDKVEPQFCMLDEDGVLVFRDTVNQKKRERPSLALENIDFKKIAQIICDYLNVPLKELSSGSQQQDVVFARSMIAYFLHYHAKYYLRDIADYFCLEPSSVSKTLQRYLKKASTDKKIQKIMDALERRLSISDVDKLVV